jgi:hypothetical protein
MTTKRASGGQAVSSTSLAYWMTGPPVEPRGVFIPALGWPVIVGRRALLPWVGGRGPLGRRGRRRWCSTRVGSRLPRPACGALCRLLRP